MKGVHRDKVREMLQKMVVRNRGAELSMQNILDLMRIMEASRTESLVAVDILFDKMFAKKRVLKEILQFLGIVQNMTYEVSFSLLATTIKHIRETADFRTYPHMHLEAIPIIALFEKRLAQVKAKPFFDEFEHIYKVTGHVNYS